MVEKTNRGRGSLSGMPRTERERAGYMGWAVLLNARPVVPEAVRDEFRALVVTGTPWFSLVGLEFANAKPPIVDKACDEVTRERGARLRVEIQKQSRQTHMKPRAVAHKEAQRHYQRRMRKKGAYFAPRKIKGRRR